MIKKCIKCGVEKRFSEFNFKNKAKRRRNARCKICTRKDTRAAYYKNQQYYLKYRRKLNRILRIKVNQFIFEHVSKNPCIDCGISDPRVLHFDHVRGKKKFIISKMRSGRYKMSTLINEMKKCVIRCANCHAIKTANEQGWYNYNHPDALAQ